MNHSFLCRALSITTFHKSSLPLYLLPVFARVLLTSLLNGSSSWCSFVHYVISLSIVRSLRRSSLFALMFLQMSKRLLRFVCQLKYRERQRHTHCQQTQLPINCWWHWPTKCWATFLDNHSVYLCPISIPSVVGGADLNPHGSSPIYIIVVLDMISLSPTILHLTTIRLAGWETTTSRASLMDTN